MKNKTKIAVEKILENAGNKVPENRRQPAPPQLVGPIIEN